eukprot:264414-Prymnesium_polylepis.1
MEFPNTRAPSPPPGPPGDVPATLAQMCEARGRGRGVARSLGATSRDGGRAGGGRTDLRASVVGPTSRGGGRASIAGPTSKGG